MLGSCGAYVGLWVEPMLGLGPDVVQLRLPVPVSTKTDMHRLQYLGQG